jgi:hypothetical protein
MEEWRRHLVELLLHSGNELLQARQLQLGLGQGSYDPP